MIAEIPDFFHSFMNFLHNVGLWGHFFLLNILILAHAELNSELYVAPQEIRNDGLFHPYKNLYTYCAPTRAHGFGLIN